MFDRVHGANEMRELDTALWRLMQKLSGKNYMCGRTR